MSDILVPYITSDGRDRAAPAISVSAADRLISKKKEVFEKGSGDLWEVVDELIKVWRELRPIEWDSSIIDMDYTRDVLDDKKYATAKGTKGSGNLRRTLDVPVFFETVLRRLFTIEELPFDKEYYAALWKKYPMFRVSEKL